MLPGDALLLLPAPPGSPAAMNAVSGDEYGEVVLATSSTRPAALRRRGYAVVRYRAWAHGDTLVLRPGVPRWCTLAATIRRRRRAAQDVLVAGRHGTTPSLVATAAPGARVRRVSFDADPRRRAAMVVVRRGAQPPALVIKISRSAEESGRAAVEQRNLATIARLGLDANVPEPRGHGTLDDHEWSMETYASGVPLTGPARPWRFRLGGRALEDLAIWIRRLAVASVHPPADGLDVARRVPLRGRAAVELAPVADALRDMVGVLVHGDLASGENILVRPGGFTIIDWETAVDCGMPLLDLLPTLTLGAARLAGCRTAGAQADHVIALCRGGNRSQWTFQHVRAYLDALGLPPASAGPLAAIAWGYQASMRERHDELVVASGREPRAWVSAAELVFERWMEDDHLGPSWRAFRDTTAAA